jgi:hypothetical protein
MNMKNKWLSLVGAAALGMLAACNTAEPPAEVSKDVAKARQDAAANVADANRQGSEKVQGQVADVRKAEADRLYKVAMAKAQGEYEIAAQKCEALSGDAQRDCKKAADARYDEAKTAAKAQYDRATS